MALRKIICSTCKTVYNIDASRIPDKPVVRSQCKKCGGVIVIRQQTAKTAGNAPPASVAANNSPPPIGATKSAPPANNPANVVRPPKPSAATADDEKQELPKPLAALKDTILDYLYGIDAIEGWEKFIYITLKVLGVLLVCKLIIFLMGLLLPAMVGNIIGLSLFVLILNWRTVLHLNSPSAWKSLLMKKPLVHLTLPLILVNLYAVMSQIYEQDILLLVFGVLLIVAFILLPFYVNYHLAIEHKQDVRKFLLLTVVGSWFVTFYLSFMLDDEEDEDEDA